MAAAFFTFDRLLTTLLFLAIALGALLMPAQGDTWWQLRAGQEMWLARRVLLHDTFSHTMNGAFWPNHEWLSQVVFYAVYAAGGLPLLTIVSATAVTAAWWLVWRLTPGSTRFKLLLTLSGIASASALWSPRPQVLSLVLLGVTITLLCHHRYIWLPLVFLLWANLHGAVVMGLLLLAAALIATGLENRKAFPSLAFASVCCLLATLATPLGVTFWTEIPQSLARIRQLGIQEWAPPRLTSLSLVPFWLSAVALVGLMVARTRALSRDVEACRRGYLTVCASALALLPLAVTAQRNVPPFLLLAVPAIAALSWRGEDPVSVRTSHRPRLNGAITAMAGVLVCGTVAYAYAKPIDHMRWAPLPEASLTALRACRGNLYNRYDEGGYLIWFAPDHKVFLDGRQDPYPVALVKAQVRVEMTGDFENVFQRYDIHCAYVPADSVVSVRLVRAGWVPLFRDAHWAVLADASGRSAPRSTAYRNPALEPTSDRGFRSFIAWRSTSPHRSK
jgi:hypothetical protein